MGDIVIFLFMYTWCNDQMRAMRTSITLNIYHFFMFGTFKILSASYLEMYNALFLTIVVTLLCTRTPELTFPV
jgi:hypothetical protein